VQCTRAQSLSLRIRAVHQGILLRKVKEFFEKHNIWISTPEF